MLYEVFRETIRNLRHEKQYLADNRIAVDQINRQLLAILFLIGILGIGALTLISLFDDSYRTQDYVFVLCVLVICFVEVGHHPGPIPITAIYFASFVAMAVYCGISSGVWWPEDLNVMILLVVSSLPLVLLERTPYIFATQALMVVVYLMFIIPLKDPVIAEYETVDLLLFALTSMGLGIYLRSMRLSNLDQSRVSMAHARIDYLTEIGSRRALFETLNDAADVHAKEPVFGIVMIDVDDFKLYNDTFGHQAGDDCLHRIGKALNDVSIERALRPYRYGGEEFVGLVGAAGAEAAEAICREIELAVGLLAIPHETAVGAVSISVGYSVRDVDEAPSKTVFNTLLYEADVALYAAKTGGKNRIVRYDPSLPVNERLLKERSLRFVGQLSDEPVLEPLS